MSVAPVYDSVLLFGDSLTEYAYRPGGFAAKLSEVYARKLEVIQRGFSGYNTDWAIPLLKQLLVPKEEPKSKIRLITIFFGANDACIEGNVQHVPLPRFKENLHTILGLLYSPQSEYHCPSAKIIFITPPPISVVAGKAYFASLPPDHPQHKTEGKVDREEEVTRRYAEAVKEVASKAGPDGGVACVDLWQALENEAGRHAQGRDEGLAELLYDGLHLSQKGYEILSSLLIQCIKSSFPHLDPDALPYVFPGWNVIAQQGAAAIKPSALPL